MSQQSSVLLDLRGQPLLRCSRCGAGLAEEDLYAEGLRLPDPGETADDYREAELLDALYHVDCRTALRAG